METILCNLYNKKKLLREADKHLMEAASCLFQIMEVGDAEQVNKIRMILQDKIQRTSLGLARIGQMLEHMETVNEDEKATESQIA